MVPKQPTKIKGEVDLEGPNAIESSRSVAGGLLAPLSSHPSASHRAFELDILVVKVS